MSKTHTPHDAAQVVSRDAIGDILISFGTTVPANATVGHAKGAVFHHTDGTGGGDMIFVNDGTRTSSDYNALSSTGGVDLAGLTATAAEINRSSDMSARVVDVTAATLAVTEALHDGKVIVLDRAAGIAVTLPTPVAGMRFEFLVKTTFTGAASIKSGAGTHVMIGHALMGNDTDNSVVLWQAPAASTYDTIDLLGTANSTGGIAGERIVITGLSATRWHVEITGDAAGTEATPFQDTVA